MPYPTTPFAERMPARRPITPDLLAAASRQSVRLAEKVLESWCCAAEHATDLDHVLVFDECVIGRPRPLLLEAAWCARAVRRADARAEFDGEYEEGDDPPTVAERVLELMAEGQEAHHLLDGTVEIRRARSFPYERADWLPLIHLTLTLERLAAELADSIRFGSAAVIDVRLPGEERGLWWAA